jgi:hypothetical protein
MRNGCFSHWIYKWRSTIGGIEIMWSVEIEPINGPCMNWDHVVCGNWAHQWSMDELRSCGMWKLSPSLVHGWIEIMWSVEIEPINGPWMNWDHVACGNWAHQWSMDELRSCGLWKLSPSMVYGWIEIMWSVEIEPINSPWMGFILILCWKLNCNIRLVKLTSCDHIQWSVEIRKQFWCIEFENHPNFQISPQISGSRLAEISRSFSKKHINGITMVTTVKNCQHLQFKNLFKVFIRQQCIISHLKYNSCAYSSLSGRASCLKTSESLQLGSCYAQFWKFQSSLNEMVGKMSVVLCVSGVISFHITPFTMIILLLFLT